jgi:ferrochelatase
MRHKIAVILAAHGEAETNRFLENYRVTSKTLAHVAEVLPMPYPLRQVIAASSSLKKLLRVRCANPGSPQNRITRDQAAALQQYLDASTSADRFSFEVHAAFSASPPYVEHIIDRTRQFDGQVIVSMAPVDTSISCGLLCSWLAASRKSDELAKVRVLSRFWDDEMLYFIYCNHLFESVSRVRRRPSALKENKRVLLLLFHGTLVADMNGNAPLFRSGLEETICMADRLRQAILSDSRNDYESVMVAYLNHDTGGTWTTPSFSEICASFSQEKGIMVDLFGCGYFADGNETIHRAGELRRSSSSIDTAIIPCINSSSSFIDYLASRITRAAVQITMLQ